MIKGLKSRESQKKALQLLPFETALSAITAPRMANSDKIIMKIKISRASTPPIPTDGKPVALAMYSQTKINRLTNKTRFIIFTTLIDLADLTAIFNS